MIPLVDPKKIRCDRECVHIRFDPYTWELSHREAALMMEEKRGSLEQQPSSQYYDLVGALAQNGLFQFLRDRGIPHTPYPFYVEGKARDECDVKIRGRKVDVKGFQMKPEWGLSPKTHVLVKTTSRNKPMDDYLFGFVDFGDYMLHLCGVISCEEFWKSKELPDLKGEDNNGKPYVLHRVSVSNLIPLMDYLRG